MKRTLTATLAMGMAAALVLTTPSVEAATATADKPWSGYRLPKTTNASSGWLGGRVAAGQVVYRIDPSRPKAKTRGFRSAQWQHKTTGTGPRAASAIDTARAAWVVGKYGRYRYGVQNAAVEVALDHLLHGGAWALSGTATRKRLTQTRRGPAIKRFALTMLRDSATYAGPYDVSLSTPPARAGQNATITVSVTSRRTGVGVARLPVALTYSGASAGNLRTSAQGTASFSVPAGTAGPHDISAVVNRVPEDRLLVRTPTTRGASRVVVAGQKARRTVNGTIAVKASPSVRPTSTSSTISTGQKVPGHVTVTGGYPSARSATIALYGPFPSAAASSCTAAYLTSSATVPVSHDGSYSSAPLSAPTAGYYTWGASIRSDAYNMAASTCSGVLLAKATPAIAATPTGSRYRSGAFIHGQVTVGGLPNGYTGTAPLRLYGPFSSATSVRCDPSLLVVTQQVAISRNGTYAGPDLAVRKRGFYLWAANLPGGPFSWAAASNCTASSATFEVIW